jgi:hypothetical protein
VENEQDEHTTGQLGIFWIVVIICVLVTLIVCCGWLAYVCYFKKDKVADENKNWIYNKGYEPKCNP